MELSGRLATFSIAELLTWVANDRRTGALVLRRTSREKRIYFMQGEIVACLTDSTTEFYGQHLLLEGHLAPEALLRSLVRCQEEGKRLGVVLVEDGILDRELVESTLADQIEDLIRDVFLWNRGIFFFQEDLPAAEEILAKPIDTLTLVLEGTRWVDEMLRLRETFTHDNLFLRRAVREEPADLRPRAQVIYRKLKSAMSIAKLYQLTGGSYFRFLVEAAVLEGRGIVKLIDHGRETPKSTSELPLSNLLLEQAAEEQMSHARRDSIPFDVLEHMVPVWATEPDDDTWPSLSEAERAFLARIDGRLRLGELLSEDRDARRLETELLIIRLRKGVLALIPHSPEMLEAKADAANLPERQRWWRPFWKKV